MVAAVVAHRHASGHRLGSLGQNDLGEGLGSMADRVDVHAVSSHPHGAPETGGAELQLGEKAGLDLFVVVFDGLQLGLLLVRQGGAGQPGLIRITIGHNDITSCGRIFTFIIVPQGEQDFQCFFVRIYSFSRAISWGRGTEKRISSPVRGWRKDRYPEWRAGRGIRSRSSVP